MQYHDNPVLDQLISSIEDHLSRRQYAPAMDAILQLHDMAAMLEDATAAAAAAIYSGVVEFRQGNPDGSVAFFKKALTIGQSHGSNSSAYYNMRAYHDLGGVYAELGDYYSSLGNYLNAYHIASAQPQYHYEAKLLYRIGSLFVWLEEFELALGYLTNAYDTYVEQAMDSPGLLSAIVLGAVEAYSCAGEFSAAQDWARNKPVDWSRQDQATLDCMLLANQVQQRYEQGEIEQTLQSMEQFLTQAKHSDEFMHMFRSYLSVGHVSIELGDQAMAARVLNAMAALDKQSNLEVFRYNFADLRVLYYRRFVKDDSAPNLTDNYYDLYYWHTQRRLEQMRSNYLSSLLLELEVDKAKFANNSVLRKSFQLEKDLELDPLTNLLNRASVEKYVTQRLAARREGEQQALLLFSIDDFKPLNDLYGHHYGDMILLEVADILNEGAASDTVVARTSGGEFLMFLSHARSADHVRSRAKDVAARAATLPLPDSKMEKISLSVGVVVIDHPMTFQEALSQATAQIS